MPIENSVSTAAFCSYHNIEISFIASLGEAGLLEADDSHGTDTIPFDQLAELEKFIRLHQDLEINLAGIEAISHLLEKIHGMRQEITILRNRLDLYEQPGGRGMGID